MRTFLIVVALTITAAGGRFPFALCIGVLVALITGAAAARWYIPPSSVDPGLQAELDYHRERMRGHR